MPFKSEAQRRYMWMKKKEGKLPGVNLHEWASKTKGKLPKHAKRRTKKASFEKRSGPIADLLRMLFGSTGSVTKALPRKDKDTQKDVDAELEKKLMEEADIKTAYARGLVERLTQLGVDPEKALKTAGLI